MIRICITALFAFGAVPVAAAEEIGKPAASTSAVYAQAPATGAALPRREPTPAMRAARERQKECAKTWRAEKSAGKTGGQKWPQYWSACNKRLKATAGV